MNITEEIISSIRIAWRDAPTAEDVLTRFAFIGWRVARRETGGRYYLFPHLAFEPKYDLADVLGKSCEKIHNRFKHCDYEKCFRPITLTDTQPKTAIPPHVLSRFAGDACYPDNHASLNILVSNAFLANDSGRIPTIGHLVKSKRIKKSRPQKKHPIKTQAQRSQDE